MPEKEIDRILEKVRSLPPGVQVVAIDGGCASGKTTLARALEKSLGAGVVHTDDFFLPGGLRTEERLAQPGGNIHYERFLAEVLPRLRGQNGFSYRCFDCHRMELGGERRVKGADIYIVEGAYSCHPVFGDYMNLKIFIHAEKEIRLQRILRREGETALQSFRERWIPMEEAYFREYRIKERADMVIDSSAFTCYHK